VRSSLKAPIHTMWLLCMTLSLVDRPWQ